MLRSADVAAATAVVLCRVPDVDVLTLSVETTGYQTSLRLHVASWADGELAAGVLGLVEGDRRISEPIDGYGSWYEWRNWFGSILGSSSAGWMPVEVTAGRNLDPEDDQDDDHNDEDHDDEDHDDEDHDHDQVGEYGALPAAGAVAEP